MERIGRKGGYDLRVDIKFPVLEVENVTSKHKKYGYKRVADMV